MLLRLVDKAASMTTLAAGVAVCTLLSAAAYRASAWQARRPAVPGRPADRIAGLDYREFPLTVLFVLDSRCPFCSASAPAFREIVRAARRAGGRIRCVAVGSARDSDLVGFLRRNGLEVGTAILPHEAVLLRQFPRTRVVTADGTLRAEWLGQLTTERAGQVVQELSRWLR